MIYKIIRYTVFFSVPGADVSLAQNLLEACGNNLEMAINMHMEGAAGGGGGAAQSHPDAAVSHYFLPLFVDKITFHGILCNNIRPLI